MNTKSQANHINCETQVVAAIRIWPFSPFLMISFKKARSCSIASVVFGILIKSTLLKINKIDIRQFNAVFVYAKLDFIKF